MPVVIRMALRNLWEHKAKSFIVGTLLALGVTILIVGNGFMDAAKAGIQRSFVANYTGDVFVSGKASGEVSLFGVSSFGGFEDTPNIPNFEQVLDFATKLPGVIGITSMAGGFGMVATDADATMEDTRGDENRRDAFIMLFGVDASTYWKLFGGLEIVQGQRLEPGQAGIMLPDDRLAKVGKYLKRDVKVGDTLLIQGFSNSGIKIRELKLVGTYKNKTEGVAPEQMSYVDINTVRILSGMTVGAAESINLTYKETSMLSTSDTDALFSDNMVDDAPIAASAITERSLAGILGDTKERERLNQVDYGAWHFIVLRTDGQAATTAAIAALNDYFTRESIAADAGDWQKAAGPYGQFVDVIRIIFIIAVVVIAVVAIIIIMNTLVVSIYERTGEIGTMRAIGADKGFVRRLFAAETLVLAFVFGLVGIALAFAIVAVLNALKIPAGNAFLEVLFGGKVMSPFISAASVASSLVLILVVGFLAHLYPVRVALKIQPVRAMQSE